MVPRGKVTNYFPEGLDISTFYIFRIAAKHPARATTKEFYTGQVQLNLIRGT